MPGNSEGGPGGDRDGLARCAGGQCLKNLAHSTIREVVLTDTIALNPALGYIILLTAPLLAQAIRRVHTNKSVSVSI